VLLDTAPPQLAMLQFAAPHLADICEALSIPLDQEHVLGHRDIAPYKSCPGRQFDIAKFTGLLKGA
jgi:N-acetyl-anhydromuramyl-L-alanine amidase AmpD